MMKKMMMLVAAAAMTVDALADTETVGGYTWTYRINGDTAEIYGTADYYRSTPCISSSSSGDVTIPSMLGGKPVTSIGQNAFWECNRLTHVTIPDTVTSIRDHAFYNCSGLMSMTIPNSVTNINSYAFSNCSGMTSVTIGNGVTSIGEGAFCDCLRLTSVTIPNSVTSIGNVAFSSCRGLTSVTISDSVTSIGNGAFAWCSGLTSVTIPDSITSIGDDAFYNCSGLTSVWIPNSITNIESSVFSGCGRLKYFSVSWHHPTYRTEQGLLLSKDGSVLVAVPPGLVNVKIPNLVTGIGPNAFSSCTRLHRLTIPDSVTNIGDWAFRGCSGLTSVTIPNSVTSIGDYVFVGCSGLTSVTIGNGLTSIGSDAFDGCSGLTSVTIPDSVTSIGEGAFADCSGLTSVTIGNGVTNIGDRAFYNCYGLTNVCIDDIGKWCGILFASETANPLYYTHHLYLKGEPLVTLEIPDGVTSIGAYAFSGYSGLTSVTIPDSVTNIELSAFSGCHFRGSFDVSEGNGHFKSVDGLLLTADGNILVAAVEGDVVIPDGVTGIGDSAFSGCSGLTSVTIPDSVTSIGDEAFSNCSGLTSVIIGDGVTNIGNKAFNGCSGLTSVTIPNSVTSIGDSAFSGCSGLTSVTMPASVTRIGDEAFSNCSGLTSVTIGDGVTNIGNKAFYGCSGLTGVTITDIAKWCGISFGNYTANPLYYARKLYLNDELLSELTLPDSVTDIGDYAFAYCSGLTSVTIPDGVTSIGDGAFEGCSGLTSVTIPDGVTSIGDGAFEGCSGLTSVTIPNSVTNIGGHAFRGCRGLTSVTIPDGVTSIGDGAFEGCSGLTSVTIPNSVTNIGGHAFSGCRGLTSVAIPDGVTSIGSAAFYGCSGLTGVTITDIAKWCGISFGNYTANPLYYARKLYLNDELLSELTLPDSVTDIGDYAFYSCSGLTSVTIPSSVTSIGRNAFEGCSGLTSLTIPNSVTNIGDYAFNGCRGLTSVTIPQCVCSKRMSQIFPAAYRNITDVVISDGVETIADSAFSGCAALTNLTIPDSVASVGSNAFAGCNKISGENGFVIVHGDVLYYCGPGGDITIPSRARRIGAYAFSSCTNITSVTIPGAVTNVGAYAFNSCNFLTNVVVGAGVENIGDYAFNGCSKIERIEISATNLTAIGWRPLSAGSLDSGRHEYVFIAKGADVHALPSRDLSSSNFDGWWTLPDGGEELSDPAAIEPFREYYAHWKAAEIGRIELNIPVNVDMFDDYYSMLCGMDSTWTQKIPLCDLVSAVYDVNGVAMDNWQDYCDVELCDESGKHISQYDLWPGVYMLKVYSLDTSICTGEVAISVRVNRHEEWQTCYWEYGSGDGYMECDFGLADGASHWDSEHNELTYSGPTAVGGYFAIRSNGSYSDYYNDYVSLSGAYGNIYARREGDGYFQYCEDWTAGNSLLISDAGLYNIEIDISGQAALDYYETIYYFDLDHGVKNYTLALNPQSISKYMVNAENCETVYTGEPISPFDGGFAVTLNEATSYYVENRKFIDAGTYAIRVGATAPDLVKCAPPDESSEWIGHMAYRDEYGNVSFDGLGTGKLLYNYVGVVDVVYTVRPRPVSEEQVKIAAPLDCVYDGNAKFPSNIIITNDFNGVELVEGTDYDVIYTDNVMPGRATAAIVCKGNYTGTITKTFEILPASFGLAADGETGGFGGETGSIAGYEGEYDGEGHGVAASVSGIGEVTTRYALNEDGPYFESLLFTNVCDETVWVELSAPGYNSFTGAVKVVITPRSIENAVVTARNIVEGPGRQPVFSLDIRDDGIGRTLVEGVDYCTNVENDDASGTTTVTVTGMGNYVGERVVETAYVKTRAIGGVDWQYWPVDDSVWLVSINQSSSEMPSVVAIPDEIDGLPVREVPDGFFAGCKSIETVVVGANVAKFGNRVFDGCTALKYVVFAGNAPSVNQDWIGGADGGESEFISVFTGAPSGVKVVAAKKDGGWGEAWPAGDEARQVMPTPTVGITPFSGKKSGRMAVTMTHDCEIPEAKVMYTIDGTEPTAASTHYEKRFSINVTGLVSVKAAVFLGGVRISDVAETRYSPVLNDVLNIGDIIAKPGSAPLFFDLDGRNQWWSDENETSYDGTPSMKSGRIGNESSSWMSATFAGAGVLEFSWKTSCEEDDLGEFYFDHAVCELDGVEVAWLDGVIEGWVREEIAVESAGEHTVTWIYVKDVDDDTIYPGADCVWVDGVKFSYPVYISFAAGDGTGEPPEPLMGAIGYEVTLPDYGDLVYPRHRFAGWSDGEHVYGAGAPYTVGAADVTLTAVWSDKVLDAPVIDVAAVYDEESTTVTISAAAGAAVYYTTDGGEPYAVTGTLYNGPFEVAGTTTIKAIAVADDWFDSAVAEAVTTRSWTSLEECLGASGFVLATGGDANWIGDAAERCVKTAANAGGWLTAAFDGAGVATYMLKEGAGEWVRHDEVFPGGGEHILRWEGASIMLKDLELLPVVSVTFSGDADVRGDLPSAIYTAEGRSVEMPGGDGLAKPRHEFAGWSVGGDVLGVGELYLVGGEDVVLEAAWTEKHLAAPVIDAPATYEADSATVTITADADVAVYYTTDGSEPSADGATSRFYQGAFAVEGSATIKAVAVRDDYFDSEVAACRVSRLPWTLGECLNWPDQDFATDGDATWERVKDASSDGFALKSGTVGNRQKSRISTVVQGPGTISFMLKVSSESDAETGEAYDGLVIAIDGDDVTEVIGGELGWRSMSFYVDGDGRHTIEWRYEKDKRDRAGEDCAWLDAVSWTPGETGAGIVIMAGGESIAFSTAADGKTRTATVAVGTTAEDVKIVVGGVDVTAGFKVAVEGTTATMVLREPYEAADATSATLLWTDNGDGNVTLNVEVVPGLYYAADSAATIEALKRPGAAEPAKAGDAVVAPKQSGTQGFYKVWVSDAPIEAE